MLNLADEDLEANIVTMFKELKEPMFIEVQEDIIALTHQLGNIKKQKLFKKQMDILELKTIMTEMGSSLEGLNSGFELAEENNF